MWPLVTATRTHSQHSLQGFTSMCAEAEPRSVMKMLHALFSRFDALCQHHGLTKIETIGDAFVAAAGLSFEDDDSGGAPSADRDAVAAAAAVAAVEFAAALPHAAAQVLSPVDGTEHVRVRVGVHTGCVTSGVVGTVMPRFSLFVRALPYCFTSSFFCFVGRHNQSGQSNGIDLLARPCASELRHARARRVQQRRRLFVGAAPLCAWDA